MKKVMCINDNWRIASGVDQGEHKPQFSEVLDVFEVIDLPCFGKHYVFSKCGLLNAFDARHFVEVDGPDEMDILADRSISDDKVREMISKYKPKS
jgi:hypothetical protein